MTKIKICGLQSVEVLKSIQALPIDLIGFVFAASRRQVTLKQARMLVREVPSSMGKVGVFVNPTRDELDAILAEVPLTHLQLHGQEAPAFCAELSCRYRVKVIKALPVKSLSELEADISRYKGTVDGFLFDTFHPSQSGGTGRRFSWDLIPQMQFLIGETPYWIAGGLNPENVGDLLRMYRPYGVDVSSGVETNGSKDIHKIAQFVEKVRMHDATN